MAVRAISFIWVGLFALAACGQGVATAPEGAKEAAPLAEFPAPLPHHDDPSYARVPAIGYLPKASIIQVPSGTEIATDGRLRLHGEEIGVLPDAPLVAPKIVTGSNFLEAVGESTSPGSFTSMSVSFPVPAAPSNYTGQTLFLFPALQQSTSETLAVALQYGPSGAGGGNGWNVAAWHITSSSAVSSGLQPVAAGATITAQFSGTPNTCPGPQKCLLSLNWTISYTINGAGGAEITVPSTASDRQAGYDLAYGGVLEADGVTLCSQLPPAGNTIFSVNSLAEWGTGAVTPSMTGTVNSGALASCGLGTTGGSTLSY